MTDPIRRVAAFDFDGTITQRDTLLGFLRHVGGSGRTARALVTHSPGLARGLRHDESRDTAKEAVLGDILRGRAEREVVEAGGRYAELLPSRFRPDIVERVRWHRDEGHELVIVSASLVYYLHPVAEALGVGHVIGVEMEVADDGRLTGSLAKANVRAAQKEVRLREWLGNTGDSADDRALELWAYGNSSGDDQLLAMSDHPVWVGKRADR